MASDVEYIQTCRSQWYKFVLGIDYVDLLSYLGSYLVN